MDEKSSKGQEETANLPPSNVTSDEESKRSGSTVKKFDKENYANSNSLLAPLEEETIQKYTKQDENSTNQEMIHSENSLDSAITTDEVKNNVENLQDDNSEKETTIKDKTGQNEVKTDEAGNVCFIDSVENKPVNDVDNTHDKVKNMVAVCQDDSDAEKAIEKSRPSADAIEYTENQQNIIGSVETICQNVMPTSQSVDKAISNTENMENICQGGSSSRQSIEKDIANAENKQNKIQSMEPVCQEGNTNRESIEKATEYAENNQSEVENMEIVCQGDIFSSEPNKEGTDNAKNKQTVVESMETSSHGSASGCKPVEKPTDSAENKQPEMRNMKTICQGGGPARESIEEAIGGAENKQIKVENRGTFGQGGSSASEPIEKATDDAKNKLNEVEDVKTVCRNRNESHEKAFDGIDNLQSKVEEIDSSNTKNGKTFKLFKENNIDSSVELGKDIVCQDSEIDTEKQQIEVKPAAEVCNAPADSKNVPNELKAEEGKEQLAVKPDSDETENVVLPSNEKSAASHFSPFLATMLGNSCDCRTDDDGSVQFSDSELSLRSEKSFERKSPRSDGKGIENNMPSFAKEELSLSQGIGENESAILMTDHEPVLTDRDDNPDKSIATIGKTEENVPSADERLSLHHVQSFMIDETTIIDPTTSNNDNKSEANSGKTSESLNFHSAFGKQNKLKTDGVTSGVMNVNEDLSMTMDETTNDDTVHLF
ncbi:hypothetical protein QYM36_015277 [Artemia franciscana]|uniref:Uncharacterized protein n=1 Tax=Artemia franciscana TaxID=6661 RepID=A0AA88H9T0_ARTSF|nr:hypothetical protein QYM36_015277 [Artemia franciscana]